MIPSGSTLLSGVLLAMSGLVLRVSSTHSSVSFDQALDNTLGLSYNYPLPPLPDETSLRWDVEEDTAQCIVGAQCMSSVSGLANDETATMSFPVWGPSTLTFFWRADSEQNYDFLDYSETTRRLTGQNGWQYEESYFPSTWDPTNAEQRPYIQYVKDGNEAAGLDQGFIDNLQQHNVTELSSQWVGAQPWSHNNWLWTSVGCDDGANGVTLMTFPPHGTPCAKAAETPDSGESFIETTVTGPGNLAFDYRVSSEQDFDFLEFIVDGVVEKSYSGIVPWGSTNFPLPAGDHTVRFHYRKDESSANNEDTAYILNVRFTCQSVTNCAKCVVPGTCDKCLDGFVLDNGQCTKCPAGSYAAVGSTSCTACTALTGCSSVTCTSASDSVCSSCDAGLYIDALGNCQPCTPIPGCSAVSCSSPSTQLCPTCNPGYEGDGTSVCNDINACINHPCGTDATCVDKAAGLGFLDNPAGRDCTCPSGSAPDAQGNCGEIDACLGYPCDDNAVCTDIFNGPNSRLGRTCACKAFQGYTGSGEVNACLKLTFVEDSLVGVSGTLAAAQSLEVSDTAGGQQISWQVALGTAGTPYAPFTVTATGCLFDSLQQASKAGNGLGFEAAAFSASAGSGSAGFVMTITCTVPVGVGFDYYFKGYFSVAIDGVASANIIVGPDPSALVASDKSVWRYPRPVILANSLYRASASTVKTDQLSQSSSASILIGFGVTNIVPINSECRVSFGAWNCEMLEPSSTSSSVECFLQDGASGTSLVLEVDCNGQKSIPGVQLLISYLTNPPAITRVQGCGAGANAMATYACPTKGQIPITIFGTDFTGTNVLVLVGGNSCADAKKTTDAGGGGFIVCSLPAGAGQSQTVLLVIEGVLAAAKNYVSYKAPAITGISGGVDCSPLGVGIGLEQCSRQGGGLLTITGENFGGSAATVRLGLDACSAVSHTNGKEHEEVTCVMPKGSALGLPLILQANKGDPTEELVTVSHVQCKAGTYQPPENSIECPKCGKGRFTDRDSLPECSACLPGTFSGGTGAVECSPCAAGRFTSQLAAEACTQCDSGSFAPFPGRAVPCQECRVGRYVAIRQAEDCVDCPAGTAQPAAGKSGCDDCTAGKYSKQKALVCTECEPGKSTESPHVQRTECVVCGRGTYQPKYGNDTCLDCPLGTYSSLQGRSECLPCEPGRVGAAKGLEVCTKCPLGQFVITPGSSVCRDCKEGQYGDDEGRVECKECSPGTYAAAEGLTSCLNCNEGYFQELRAQTVCLQCDPGTAQSARGQKQCIACVAGKFSNQSAARKCQDCRPGRFQIDPSQEGCLECELGKAQPSSGQNLCITCVAGRFAAEEGTKECSLCSPGTYQNAPQQKACELCPPGATSLVGDKECTACDGASVARFAGSPRCENCPLGTFSSSGIACSCEPGKYSLTTLGQECFPCPTGAKCGDGGVVLATMEIGPGWWRPSNTSAVLYRCQFKGQCVGGSRPGELNAKTGDAQCAPFRHKELCASCVKGYRSAGVGNSECAACGSDSSNVFYTILILSLVLLALVLMFCFVLRMDKQVEMNAKLHLKEVDSQHHNAQKAGGGGNARGSRSSHSESSQRSRNSLHRLSRRTASIKGGRSSILEYSSVDWGNDTKAVTRNPSILYKLKILVGFAQIAIKTIQQGQLTWPSQFAAFMEFFTFLNFDFIPWQSIGCFTLFDYMQKALVVGILPIVLVFLMYFIYYIPMKFIENNDVADSNYLRHSRLLRNKKFVKIVLFTIFLLYPHVSSVIMGVYNCIPVEGVSYLVGDFSIICGDSKWNTYAVAMLVFLLFYPIGIPGFYYYKLGKSRTDFRNPVTQLELGFLYLAYSERFWWFECLDMFFKLVMTSAIVFLPNYMELAAGMIITCFYLIWLLLYNPYIRKGDFRLHLFAMADLMLLYMVGLTMQVNNEQEIDGLSEWLVSLVLIGVVCVFFAIFLTISFKNVFKTFRGFQNKKQREKAKELARRASSKMSVSEVGDLQDAHFDALHANEKKKQALFENVGESGVQETDGSPGAVLAIEGSDSTSGE